MEERFAEELRATQEELQGTIQSLEAANEDLQGSNEEIMSMNEELQSTNEELETSKEELQSLNEELTTVNNELRSKICELERLNNDLANLFAGTRVATLFLDRNLHIMRYTPPVQGLLYLLRSDVGRSLRDIKLKFDDPELFDDAAAVLGDLNQREREVRGEDGRWWLRRMLPYRTLDDSIEGVVISFADISEMKAAVVTAQRNEEQLRLLADALPALIAYIDSDFHFVFANAAYQEWFDITPNTLQGRHLESLLGAEHFAAIAKHCEAAVTGERVVYKDTLEHRRLGSRSVHVTHVPYAGDDSDRQGFYLLATDLTELDRQAQAAHANRVASMSELAATIAHQLNQPLGSITSYAGALKRMLAAEGGGETRSVADKIAIQARAASDILNELREFIGRRSFDQGMVDLNVLVRRVCILTEGRTATVAAAVDLDLADNLPKIQGSPMQLEQLLVNLFVNALEAMQDTPTRRLSIATRYDRDNLQLSVSDTGPGVAADRTERIFDAFYTDKARGMGMGLAICRSIAEEHGGTLWLDPDTATGASFHVRLPVGGDKDAGKAISDD